MLLIPVHYRSYDCSLKLYSLNDTVILLILTKNDFQV